MKIISFSTRGIPSWGVLEDDVVLDVGKLSRTTTFGEALFAGVADEALKQLEQAEKVALADIRYELAFTASNKILCVGTNYDGHIRETNSTRPKFPVIFSRFIDSFVPHQAATVAPRVSETYDFEGEFAVVIGKAGREIPVEDAMNHVWGYTILNDGSVREFQRQTHQFTPGKNFFATGSIGPVVVDKETFGPIEKQRLTTILNSETVQNDTLDQMIFSVPEIIEYVSQWTPLRPGDVIATGTPEGVGAARTPELWLKDGDQLSITIEGIGTLENTIGSKH